MGFSIFDANGKEVTSANFNINALITETSISDSDYVPIYDASAGANRKMTKANFVSGLVNSYSAVSAYKTTTTTGLAATTWNKITFDTERFDIGGTFSSSTWTVPRTGYARITLNISYYFSGNTNANFALYQNGSRITTTNRMTLAVFFSADIYDSRSYTWIIPVTASDTIEAYMYHHSAVTGKVAGDPNGIGNGGTELMCEMI